MFNLKEKDNEETILDELFESREASLYMRTEVDKKKIADLTKDNDSYEKFYKYGFADAVNLILNCVSIS